jgi:hypothetical protein
VAKGVGQYFGSGGRSVGEYMPYHRKFLINLLGLSSGCAVIR